MLDFKSIEADARHRAVECLHRLMPDGKLHGAEFSALNPTRNDHTAGSFSYNVRKHVWSDFASGDKGCGLISLWGYTRSLRFVDAAREVAKWLGGYESDLPATCFRREIPPPERTSQADAWITGLWRQALPAHGTPVETYLHNRGIVCPIPPTIRFLPAHSHKESGLSFPVMLAAVSVWPSKTVTALHRTFLKPDGSGKAEVTPSKKMVGRVSGGAVRLAAPTDKLAIGEGIETSLSAQQASHVPTWAGLSTSGLMNLVLPAMPLAQEIIIAADSDPAGMTAAHYAAVRWSAEGRTVRIAAPTNAKDFNDLLRMP